MNDVESLPYTAYRVALASAILGSVGATFAWIVWLTVQLFNCDLVITVVVGAILGFSVEWVVHYVRVAKREKLGESAHGATHGLPRRRPGAAALVWAFGFAMLGLVTEHLVAHIAAEFLVPFFASLVSLLPAGLIIGWTMGRGREKDENLFNLFANGILIGGAITLVTGLPWSAAIGDVPWLALFSWWGLIGVGTRVVARAQGHSVRLYDPALAVGLVYGATLLLNQLPIDTTPLDRFGVFATIPKMVRVMAAEIQESPGVPATFWMDAEKRFRAQHPTTAGKAPAEEESAVCVKLKRFFGQEAVRPAAPAAARRDPGAGSPAFRSWLVMLLFAVGVGAAPWLERSLRPIDYPNSVTYRNDLILSVAVVLLVVVSSFIAWVVRK